MLAHRKKKSGAQKVLQDYGSVIAGVGLFLALCACVALRGNATHWKTEAADAQQRYLDMEKRFGDMQITHSHLRVRTTLPAHTCDRHTRWRARASPPLGIPYSGVPATGVSAGRAPLCKDPDARDRVGHAQWGHTGS